MIEVLRLIAGIQAPFNMVVFIVMFGCLAGAVSSIATETRKYFCHREDLEFKRELVDQGLSSGEIELVMRAKSKHAA